MRLELRHARKEAEKQAMGNKTRFVVQVPASTSNLGSGFDTVSAALSLYLRVEIERSPEEQIEWESGWDLAEENILDRSLRATLEFLRVRPPGMRIRMDNPIPLRRGLGSSAAAIIAGIRIAEYFCGVRLSEQDRFEIGYPLEGHPDNLAACLLGGWVLSRLQGGKMLAERLDSPLVCRFVLAIPESTIATDEARDMLPEGYPRIDTVYNLQRCALLVHALHTGRTDLLREATKDRLHQSYRSSLVPGLERLLRIEGLKDRLADSLLGVYISGAGSSVVALAGGDYDEIGIWMTETLAREGTSAFYRVLDLDTQGARVL